MITEQAYTGNPNTHSLTPASVQEQTLWTLQIIANTLGRIEKLLLDQKAPLQLNGEPTAVVKPHGTKGRKNK